MDFPAPELGVDESGATAQVAVGRNRLRHLSFDISWVGPVDVPAKIDGVAFASCHVEETYPAAKP